MPRTKKIVTETDETPKERKPPAVRHPIDKDYDLPGDFALYVRHNGLYEGTDAQIYNLSRAAFERPKMDLKTQEPIKGDDGEVVMLPPNGFPAIAHTDGRTIIHREQGIEWLKNYQVAQSQRRAGAQERLVQRASTVVLGVGRYTLMNARAAKTRADADRAQELATVGN